MPLNTHSTNGRLSDDSSTLKNTLKNAWSISNNTEFCFEKTTNSYSNVWNIYIVYFVTPELKKPGDFLDLWRPVAPSVWWICYRCGLIVRLRLLTAPHTLTPSQSNDQEKVKALALSIEPSSLELILSSGEVGIKIISFNVSKKEYFRYQSFKIRRVPEAWSIVVHI